MAGGTPVYTPGTPTPPPRPTPPPQNPEEPARRMCETTHTAPDPLGASVGPRATRRKAVGRSSGSCFNVEAAGNPRRRGIHLTKMANPSRGGDAKPGSSQIEPARLPKEANL